MSVWHLHIHSPGATLLNLGFSRYNMPEEGKLFIYTPNQKQKIGPFTSKDNNSHGQLWTPIIKSDHLFVEINVPTSKINQLDIELGAAFKINSHF